MLLRVEFLTGADADAQCDLPGDYKGRKSISAAEVLPNEVKSDSRISWRYPTSNTACRSFNCPVHGKEIAVGDVRNEMLGGKRDRQKSVNIWKRFTSIFGPNIIEK